MAIRVIAISDAKKDPLLDVARDWLARADRRFGAMVGAGLGSCE